MSGEQCMALLGGWEGHVVGTVGRFEAGVKGPRTEAWIELHPKADAALVCDACGGKADHVHDSEERWVRDLPVFDADTWLLVHRRRVWCGRCGGPKLERVSWLAAYARVTQRLAANVALLCAALPVKKVAQYFCLNWKTVKAIDKRSLAARLGEADLSNVELIAMDEFAIQKGHRYATVIVEFRTKRVLWVGRGRAREDVRPFFEALGESGRARLKAVAMDMTAAYAQEVKRWCPQAQVVYDLFHVVAKYGREVVDRVRVDEANRLRHDKPARKVIKGARWLLLRNKKNIEKPADRVRLRELLAANRKLATVYVLKDDLKQLWRYRQAGSARRFWTQWYHRAIRSRIEPLKSFARRLKGYLSGIIAHCRWPLNTSMLEGINNKIKVLKRIAYGYRDDDYFFLKIRGAFPGDG